MSSERAGSAPDSSTVVAYLMLAHHRPDQAGRLARRICELSDRARVLVHWDASSTVSPPTDLPARATLTARRVATGWGRWSLVEATLILLDEALRGLAPGWFVLVSGEDWPARDLARWEDELDRSGSDAVIEADPIVDRWAAGQTTVPLLEDEARRYVDGWRVLPRPGARPAARATDAVVRVAQRWASHRRRYPALMDLYGRGYAVAWRRGTFPVPSWTLWKGHQWLTLGERAARAVLEAPPAVTEHYRRTLIPDESYVQTIVHNTPGLTVHRGVTSFAPWHAFSREPHLVLHPEDVPHLAASGAPFARKVGVGPRASVTDLLDAAVGRRPPHGEREHHE